MDEHEITPLKNISNILGRTEATVRKHVSNCEEEIPNRAIEIDKTEIVSSLQGNQMIKVSMEDSSVQCTVRQNFGDIVVVEGEMAEIDCAESGTPIDMISTDVVKSCNTISVKNCPTQSFTASNEEKPVNSKLVSNTTLPKCDLLEVVESNTVTLKETSKVLDIKTDLIFNHSEDDLTKSDTSNIEIRGVLNSTNGNISFSNVIESDKEITNKPEKTDLEKFSLNEEDKSTEVFSEWTEQLKSSTPREKFSAISNNINLPHDVTGLNPSTSKVKRLFHLTETEGKKVEIFGNEDQSDECFLENSKPLENHLPSNDIMTTSSSSGKHTDPLITPNSKTCITIKRKGRLLFDINEGKRKKIDIETKSANCLTDKTKKIQNTDNTCQKNMSCNREEKRNFDGGKNQLKEKLSALEHQMFKVIEKDEKVELAKNNISFLRYTKRDDNTNYPELKIDKNLETIGERYKTVLSNEKKILEIDLTDENYIEMKNENLNSNCGCKENVRGDIVENKVNKNTGNEARIIDHTFKSIQSDNKEEAGKDIVFIANKSKLKNDNSEKEIIKTLAINQESSKVCISSQETKVEIDLTGETNQVCDKQLDGDQLIAKDKKKIKYSDEIDKKPIILIETDDTKEIRKEFPKFVSDDPKENDDNDNPEWEIIKKLETDEDRYKNVRKRWRNLIIPDPNKNLTCIHARPFKCPSYHSNVKISETTRKSHKRTFSYEPTTSTNQVDVKRARTRSCTTSYDIKVQNHYKEMEEESRKLSADKRNALANTDDYYNKQFSYLMSSDLKRYNYWEFQHRIAKLMADKKEAQEAVHKDFSGAFERLENEKHRQASVFLKAMKEVEAFHKFYRKLDESTRDDCFYLTDVELDDVMETDKLYEKFNTFYS